MLLTGVIRNLSASAIVRIGSLVTFLVAVGIVGYVVIEGWSLLDAAYMTVLTFTTVGYEEVHPLSTGGRIFSIFLMVTGVGAVMYAFTATARTAVEEGAFRGIVRRRRMRTKMAGLHGHTIVCGYGRVGREVVEVLLRERGDVIVIDNDPQTIGELSERDLLYVQGDATMDDVLVAAGIATAKAVVAATGSDSDNVLVTLSARALNSDAAIVARSSLKENEEKLLRAGASRVVSPYSIGGRRMALSAVRPAAVDYFDSMAFDGISNNRVEEILVPEGSPLDGSTLAQCRRDTGVRVLAMKREDQELQIVPDVETVIQAGDLLVVFGTPAQLDPLERQTP